MSKTIESIWESKSILIVKGESSGYGVIKFEEKFFGYTDLLVRPVYHSLYEQMVRESNNEFNSAVLGMPGIGISAFLIYTPLRRTDENKPTLLQMPPRYPLLVLNKDNIIKLSEHESATWRQFRREEKSSLRTYIWILCGTNPNKKIMTKSLKVTLFLPVWTTVTIINSSKS